MMTPEERYARDPVFRTLVDALEGYIHAAQFTPTELREAAILAAVHYDMKYGMPTRIRLKPERGEEG